MPRFYFDVWDGAHITRDDTGLQLASLNAAEDEAVKAAAGISHDSFPRRRGSEVVVQVRDDHSQQVVTVAVSMTVRRIEPLKREQ